MEIGTTMHFVLKTEQNGGNRKYEKIYHLQRQGILQGVA